MEGGFWESLPKELHLLMEEKYFVLRDRVRIRLLSMSLMLKWWGLMPDQIEKRKGNKKFLEFLQWRDLDNDAYIEWSMSMHSKMLDDIKRR